MLRRLLLKQLDQLTRPTPATLFVLLWDFFQQAGLNGAENRLREVGEPPAKLVPLGEDRPYLANTPKVLTQIEQFLPTPKQFDLFALRWLKHLDLDLKISSPSRSAHAKIDGLGATTFWLKARNNWIADSIVAQGSQIDPPGELQGDSPTLLPYCRNFMAVPTKLGRGRELKSLTLGHLPGKWQSGELESLLGQAANEQRFTALLWPFSTPISYVGIDLKAPLPNPSGFNPVRLAEIENEQEILREAVGAVAEARQRKATVLLFPELSLSPTIVASIQEELRRETNSRWPLLTMLGCCHRPQPAQEGDINEALLLGPNGDELHRHRKLSNFKTNLGEAEIGERLEVGHVVTVLESPIGNFVPLICLDCFQDTMKPVLEVCHGNIHLVPSLSETTSAHREPALAGWRQRLVTTLLCNRWLETSSEEKQRKQTSFVQLGDPSLRRFDHWPDDLARERERNAPQCRVERTSDYLFVELVGRPPTAEP